MDINNSITEDYCSFEVSKLLKEKGFESVCNSYYNSHLVKEEMGYANYNRTSNLEVCSRPTHALAIKWLRLSFGIIINPVYIWLDKYWGYEIYTGKDNHDENEQYKTPEEATEAALLYTLKNLI